jgi:hypothetical protein
MSSFFKVDPLALQFLPVGFFQRAAVGNKNGISLLRSQQRRADATLSPSEYDHAFIHSRSKD